MILLITEFYSKTLSIFSFFPFNFCLYFYLFFSLSLSFSLHPHSSKDKLWRSHKILGAKGHQTRSVESTCSPQSKTLSWSLSFSHFFLFSFFTLFPFISLSLSTPLLFFIELSFFLLLFLSFTTASFYHSFSEFPKKFSLFDPFS